MSQSNLHSSENDGSSAADGYLRMCFPPIQQYHIPSLMEAYLLYVAGSSTYARACLLFVWVPCLLFDKFVLLHIRLYSFSHSIVSSIVIRRVRNKLSSDLDGSSQINSFMVPTRSSIFLETVLSWREWIELKHLTSNTFRSELFKGWRLKDIFLLSLDISTFQNASSTAQCGLALSS